RAILRPCRSGSGTVGVRNAKRDLYDAFKPKVLMMELVPDTEGAERCRPARTPVRETSRRLAGKGYIQTGENKGARVALMDHAEIAVEPKTIWIDTRDRSVDETVR